jgi:two-component system response regulator FixJ
MARREFRWRSLPPGREKLEMALKPTIFIVDDDDTVARFLQTMLTFAGFEEVKVYLSSRTFLDEAPIRDDDCILLDIRMPDFDGLQVLRELNARRRRASVIVLTGYGDVPLAVEAMRRGAVDFIEKPFSNESLVASIHRALSRSRAQHHVRNDQESDVVRRLQTLTSREREVYERMIQGLQNKQIAYDLGISQRTVEVHRSKILAKMRAQNLPTLIRMSLAAGITQPETPNC